MSDPWVYEKDAAEIGWYAVLLCWDPEEGIIPSTNFWEGRWQFHGPVIARSPTPLRSRDAAGEWADKHDPDQATA
jgi:hypothetical protein